MRITGRTTCLLLSALSLSMLCPDARGGTVYVDDDGPADFNNIQAGIEAANDGDTVLVASGEYVITEPITFRGKAITIRSEAGPDETTIRMGAPSDIHRGGVVIFENGETVESVLQGFTITGGNGFWVSSISAYAGGGITFDASSGTVENCVIVQNRVEASGGGILCAYASSPRILGCTIAENSAGVSGGGVFSWHGASPTVTDCTIMKNSARDDAGGGLHSGTNSSVTITRCMISENYAAKHGAGIMSWDNSSVILINCTLTKNSSDSEEGAVFCGQNSSMTITNCTIVGNFASSECGALLCWQNASVTIKNSILWGNIAPQGGEVRVRNGGVITISNSDVAGGRTGAIIDGGGTLNWGEGNIDADPRFACFGYLDDKGTRDSSDDVWVDGDYHLKSEEGRWDPNSESWVIDDITSPCIDAGDTNSPVAAEPFPNGGIVNMGAFGGTAEASKSPSGLHARYGGGTGEPDNPYLIYTPEHMNTIGLHDEDRDKHFKLMADIDLGGLGARDFNIIGVFPSPFKGVFDGNGHTISNFTYISTDVDGIALFSQVEGAQAEIRDLGLINPAVDAGMVDPDVNSGKGNRAGSLVHYLRAGTLSRCYVQGGSVSGDLQVGGLVAYNRYGTIADCRSTADVAGSRDVGGLVGYNENGGTITSCHAISIVTGEGAVGGLAGNNDGTIQDSSAMGDVMGDSNVGGLVGYNDRHGTIEGSYSTGRVTAVCYVGGLVGKCHGDLTNCYSTGTISGGRYVGGLVGFLSGLVTDCYSTGHVTHEPIEGFGGNPRISGLVGSGYDFNDVLQSFWDIGTSGQTMSFGGTGLTTAEMQTAGTFLEAGWDFVGEIENGTDDIWWIDEGGDYPRLWWELIPDN